MQSIWLQGEGDSLKLCEGLSFLREKNTYKIHVTGDNSCTVNGNSVVSSYELKDGDYVASKDFRGIFQTDPVADWRKDWECSEESLDFSIDIKPSKRLMKSVDIDTTGVSLDAGKHITEWHHIRSIYFYNEHTSGNWSVTLLNATEKVPSDFRASILSGEEAMTLLQWIHFSSPFHISFSHFSRETFPNAYDYLAFAKIIDLARLENREPPAPIQEILAIQTPRQTVVRMLQTVFFIIVVSVILFLALKIGRNVHASAFGIILVVLNVMGIPAYWSMIQHIRRYYAFISRYKKE
jgi:hypothetical protein